MSFKDSTRKRIKTKNGWLCSWISKPGYGGTENPNSRRQQDREKLKRLAPAPQMDLFG
jgi:hypothetical protein